MNVHNTRAKTLKSNLNVHAQCFFLGANFGTVVTQKKIQCECYKGFLWQKYTKSPDFEGQKLGVAIFRQ